eukprot:SAG31_NODE_1663_length_7581_cov_10.076399_2_plen_110_part_00
MLLGYNAGALVSLALQVSFDAHFDRKFGPRRCYTFRANLGLGLLLGTLLVFPWCPAESWVPVLVATMVGLADYFADGSLTQLGARVGTSMPNCYFAGQSLSGKYVQKKR